MVTMLKTRRQVNKLASTTLEARAGVQHHGVQAMARARMQLAKSHGAAPHAYIEGEFGKKDFYIILNDTRGTSSAMTIEFGRRGGNLDKNGRVVTASRAVAPLRTAVGLQ